MAEQIDVKVTNVEEIEETKDIKKNIKFYSEKISAEDYAKIEEVAVKYTSAKNYFCSRYAGAKNLPFLHKNDTKIRDALQLEYEIAHSKDDCNKKIDKKTGEVIGYKPCRYGNIKATKRNTTLDTLGLPARLWKQALSEAKSTIKSAWSNARNRARVAVFKNENLSDKDRHYIFYILYKYHSDMLSAVLCHKPVVYSPNNKGVMPDFADVDTEHLNKLICRYIRRYKGKIPYSKKQRSFMLDTDMYKITDKGLKLMTCEKKKMVLIKVKNIHDLKKYKNLSSIRIVLDKDNKRAEIHFCISLKPEKNENEKIIGLDKNYTNLFAISEGKEYGCGIGEIFTAYTEEINEKTKRKNPYYAKIKNYKEELKDCKDQKRQEYLMWKIKNIEENNIGTKKYNKRKLKVQAHLQGIINHEIRLFVKEQKPKLVVLEDLTFKSEKKKYMPKKYNRKMSTWCKGYLQKRLEYILGLKGIQIVMVNPAYTSQQCSECGGIGERKYKDFYCHRCNKHLDADINASKNILQRYYDREIKMYMKPKEVLSIINGRVK